MPRTLLDTDILSFMLRKHPIVINRATQYLSTYPKYTFSLITRYEILRGLKAKNAVKQLAAFDLFCQNSEILPITEEVISHASDIYAILHQRGQLIGDADLLIAATALDHDLILATNNENHFSRVSNLRIDNWSKP
ncbi:MAG TPA: VapC toxin family PIN domain ribonuclease [Gammaproteobacteria bacterium]|nr:VapC toxin family PIN domain ribonuclease [Gammaproteobacteria bacterium]